MKLHSKLSGKPNSYVPESLRQASSSSDSMGSRIGNGVFFVGKVLDKIGRGSERCRARLEEIYNRNVAPVELEEPSGKKKKTDMEER